MSFFGVGNLGNPFSTTVGQKIEHATDGSLPSENWGLNMEICDLVNSSPDAAKDAVKAIRKRLTQNAGKNYTVVMYTLTVLEACVKNCGKSFHVLVCTKDFIGELVKLIGPKNDPPTVVQEKVLGLIQTWSAAFESQPELVGVQQVYNELKSKGVEFPMTDLDTMSPIYTPYRATEDTPDSPLELSGAPNYSPARQMVGDAAVTLSESQTTKLRADLNVVEGNMDVMNDMLSEMTPQDHVSQHEQDIDLLNELAGTLRAMQSRVAELVGRVAGDSPLCAELLDVNDRLNNLLLRHSRFINNRNAVTGMALATPAAVLGAAMGVPGVQGATQHNDDALIDLSDAPDIATLSVKDNQPAKSPGGSSKDEFDMFAQSRNVTYETSKTGGSSYADNMEGQTSTSLAAAAQRAGPPSTTQQPAPSGMEQREIDEIAAWLAQEKAVSEAGAPESVTSSDFDRFLEERAAAAETLPSATSANATPSQTPRHRQIKKDDQDPMFAL